MKTILDDDDAFEFRFKLGITQQPRIMIVLCNFFAKHFTIVRVKAQLDQMIDGLKLLIYDLIKANPCSMHKLFTKPAPITSDVMIKRGWVFACVGQRRQYSLVPRCMILFR